MNTQRISGYKATCPKHLFIHEIEGKGLGLFAKTRIKRKQHVFEFSGQLKPLAQATPMSLQLSDDLFLVSDGRFDDLINHSCDPNGIVQYNGSSISLFAFKDIEPGDELSFNYNTTEWDLIQQTELFGSQCSLGCCCGNANCQGEITGFKYLSLQEKIRISPMASPFLRFRMMEELWQRSLLQPAAVASLTPVLPNWALEYVLPA